MPDSSDPALDLADWQLRWREFVLECAGAGRDEEVDMLRAAIDLLALAPRDLRAQLGTLPDAGWVDGAIAARAVAAVALDLLDGWAGYMLSHGRGGPHMATVAVRSGREASAEGATATLALLGALAQALAQAKQGARTESLN